MSIANFEKAEVLTEALPYIRQYKGQTVVVKLGGKALNDSEIAQGVVKDIVLLSHIGVKVVLVHGGTLEVDSYLERQGFYNSVIDGVKVLDAGAAMLTQMLLSGKINKSLVARLEQAGQAAVGISGVDAGMITARKISEKTGFAGKIEKINAKIITDLIDDGYIPVVSAVGADSQGNIYDVNADAVASAIAYSTGAYALISMTDVAGVLNNKDDENSLISVLNVADVPKLVKDGVISDGMVAKTDFCTEAVRRGVKKVFVIDGRVPHSLLIEILSDEGIGTMLV